MKRAIVCMLAVAAAWLCIWPALAQDVPGPDAEPSPDFAGEWFTELVGRAINGVELPDYAEVPDSAAPAGSPITSSAKP